jgi:Coenzyme PQQ synthesis protein D (PqqD)
MEIDERLRYAVNSPPVVHESFGDEAVIVNLNSGAYYSLEKSGLAIWNLIVAGASIGEIVDQISVRYAGARADIVAAVLELISSLRREELIQPAAETNHAGIATDANSNGGDKIAFEPPLLNKFTDVEDLLVLDPIHDVDAAGWPQKR